MRITDRTSGRPRMLAMFAGVTAALCLASLLSFESASLSAATLPDAPRFDLTAGTIVTLDKFLYLPFLASSTIANGCLSIPTESYATLSVNPPPTDRPAEQHADLNLGWRTYTPTTTSPGLINLGGSADGGAPQFPGLFGDNRTPQFSSAAQVYTWSWSCNCRTTPITQPPVTLLGMVTTPGEVIHTPDSGYRIGSGYEVLVLYAAPTRITLKYTRDDNVITGYTIHLEHVCIEPTLLALYQTWNSNGRGQLPALHAGQAFGRAGGEEIAVAIQDSGTWMEPRSRKDWWQGR
jgi:hypothetical protein